MLLLPFASGDTPVTERKVQRLRSSPIRNQAVWNEDSHFRTMGGSSPIVRIFRAEARKGASRILVQTGNKDDEAGFRLRACLRNYLLEKSKDQPVSVPPKCKRTAEKPDEYSLPGSPRHEMAITVNDFEIIVAGNSQSTRSNWQEDYLWFDLGLTKLHVSNKRAMHV